MSSHRRPWTLALSLSFALACGPDGGDDSGTDGSTDANTNASTGGPTTGTPTTGTPTTGATTDATTDATTTDTPTTGDATSDATTTTGPGTTGDDTTTGVEVNFERFRVSRAAGPCPPDADCDGFIELLASRTLRFEPFGEPGNPVLEAEISEQDFAVAVPLFASPELIALLDQEEPLCDPPTDIFETMAVDVDGGMHEKATTTCDQPEVVAARETANALVMQYFP
jgi:hypothetical protein